MIALALAATACQLTPIRSGLTRTRASNENRKHKMANLVQLNEDQFQATFVDPMHRLGEDEDYEAVSLKEYVTECIADLGLATTLDCLEIHHVYINGNKTSCHVMLYYGEPNRYLVIVTDYVNKTIRGHRVLDLNEKYGIPNTE